MIRFLQFTVRLSNETSTKGFIHVKYVWYFLFLFYSNASYPAWEKKQTYLARLDLDKKLCIDGNLHTSSPGP